MNNLLDIEKQVIGKLLIDHKIYFEHQELFNMYEFSGVNKFIYETISVHIPTGKVSTIAIAKAVGGHFPGKSADAINYLTQCRASVDLNELTDEQLLYLIENKNNGILIKGTQVLASMALGGSTLDEIKSYALEIFKGIEDASKTQITPFLSNLTALTERVVENRLGQKESGLKTGIHEYDRFNGGMQYSDLELIGGKTSMGKTAFVLQRAKHVASNGNGVGIFNYEMSAIQLTARIISPIVPISGKNLLMFPLSDPSFENFNKAIGQVQDLPIYIGNTNNNSVQYAIKQMRYMNMKLGIRYFIFDFINRMKLLGFRGNREQEIGLIGQALKDEAKALDSKVDGLVQLNRSGQNEGAEPTLNSIRDSGQLEESADIVTFIHRPEYYLGKECNEDEKGKAKIIQAKGRNSGITDYWVGFNSEYTEFFNLGTYDDKKNTSEPFNQIQPNYEF